MALAVLEVLVVLAAPVVPLEVGAPLGAEGAHTGVWAPWSLMKFKSQIRWLA